jgi:hypothetical protein
MPLLDLLTGNAFELGVTTDSWGNSLPRIPGIPPNGGWASYPNAKNAGQNQVAHSKAILNSQLSPQSIFSYQLSRVTWDVSDTEANPTFLGDGIDHNNGGIVDGLRRGGSNTWDNRVEIDNDRIQNFLLSPQGDQFRIRQKFLQALNPRPETRNFNLGPTGGFQATIKDRDVQYKRHGTVAEAAGLPSLIGMGGQALVGLFGDSALGNLAGNIVTTLAGGDYITVKSTQAREFNMALGHPGRPQRQSLLEQAADLLVGSSGPQQYDVNVSADADGNFKPIDTTTLDYLNYIDIVKAPNGVVDPVLEGIIGKDFVPFNFEPIDPNNFETYDIIAFRAFLDSMDDQFNAEHNEVKYNGRAESFYTYNKLMSTVSISWKTDYPWEIRLDRNDGGRDTDVLILPHVLDITCNYIPIHSFTPRNRYDIPFIGINAKHSTAKSFMEKPISEDASDLLS